MVCIWQIENINCLCFSPFFEHDFLNQTSYLACLLFLLNEFSIFNSMIYSLICQLVYFAVVLRCFKLSPLLLVFMPQFKLVIDHIKDLSDVFSVEKTYPKLTWGLCVTAEFFWFYINSLTSSLMVVYKYNFTALAVHVLLCAFKL